MVVGPGPSGDCSSDVGLGCCSLLKACLGLDDPLPLCLTHMPGYFMLVVGTRPCELLHWVAWVTSWHGSQLLMNKKSRRETSGKLECLLPPNLRNHPSLLPYIISALFDVGGNYTRSLNHWRQTSMGAILEAGVYLHTSHATYDVPTVCCLFPNLLLPVLLLLLII